MLDSGTDARIGEKDCRAEEDFALDEHFTSNVLLDIDSIFIDYALPA